MGSERAGLCHDLGPSSWDDRGIRYAAKGVPYLLILSSYSNPRESTCSALRESIVILVLLGKFLLGKS